MNALTPLNSHYFLYVDDSLLIFKSRNYNNKCFYNLNVKHPNIKLGCLAFLDINVSRPVMLGWASICLAIIFEVLWFTFPLRPAGLCGGEGVEGCNSAIIFGPPMNSPVFTDISLSYLLFTTAHTAAV